VSGAKRFHRLPEPDMDLKKLHDKDGPILSQPRAVPAENRGIGLIFLP